MDNCIFCKIIKNEIPAFKIYEDEKILAFLDLFPTQKGHVLVIPKEHKDYIFDLDDEIYSELILKVKELSHPIKSAMEVKRIGVLIQGFEVPHIHVHLIPINRGDKLEKLHSEKADEKELKEVQEKILKEMNKN